VAEISPCRRLDPIGARAEIDAVEVELENLVLRILALEPESEDRFLDLARESPLLGEEEVLGELLGEHRAALDGRARGRVAGQRAQDREGIDAEMGIEAAVLDGNEGLGHEARQIIDLHRGSAGVAAIGEKRPVLGEDGDIRRPLRHRELVDRRKLCRVIDDDRSGRDRAPDPEGGKEGQKPERRRAPSACRASPILCLARHASRSFGSRAGSEEAQWHPR
jgi:hypothetical protein